VTVTAAPSLEVRYPYTGDVVGTVPLLAAENVRRTLDFAGQARVRLDRSERSGVLEQVARTIEAAAAELAIRITQESGLALADTQHEVARAVDVFRLASHAALRDDGQMWAGDISPNGRPRRAFTTREPVRLVAAITPFNHPLNQVAHKLAPARGW
jgi:aldehyde dehydrogenase (NAD+)